MVKDIRISEFDYNLPDERIARHPLVERDACKLLLSRPDGLISHRIFNELPSLLPIGAMMVCNDTRVINARIGFHKETGARIEIFLLEPVAPADYALVFQTTENCRWNCLVGNLKKWKEGELTMQIHPEGYPQPITLKARNIKPADGGAHEIEFSWDNPSATFATVIETAGNIPIPPYLKRESEESDTTDYQTVYADVKGSVAAPTAGLHFTNNVMDGIRAHGVDIERLTLHVGAGTFQPVKSETIGGHPMHTEVFSISKNLVGKLIEFKKSKRPILAVGTTTVRTLESLPYIGYNLLNDTENPFHVGQWLPYEGEKFNTIESLEKLFTYMEGQDLESLTATTAIMIAPGFNWRITDVMVTNFHQPQSTLLLLVSSFLQHSGKTGHWKEIYESALQNDYRFLSYGDACLLFPVVE